MGKHTFKIIFLGVLLSAVVGYSIILFQRINYNKTVLATNIYHYIPQQSDYIVSFNRNYHFEEYFELDSANNFIINAIHDHITLPLLILKKENSEKDVVLFRVTKDQEEQIKNILKSHIAPYHQPKKRKDKGCEVLFYPLPKNKFLIVMFNKGVVAMSLDYPQIESLIESQSEIVASNIQEYYYMERMNNTSPVSFFINCDSTFFALSYLYQKDNIIFEGKYSGKLCEDSILLSYNEINNLLRLSNHYTDSVIWKEDCNMKIQINKVK